MNDKLTIFYADDDPDDQDFFKIIIDLIGEKYEVMTHMDGLQLLDALENPPPSPYLVFLDINMPRMNGIEVLKKVRQSEKYGNLPIIIFSTSKDGSVIQQTMELGANYYVPKSAGFKELKKSIEHSLQINWETFVPDSNTFLYKDN